jgi:hypothetical protein
MSKIALTPNASGTGTLTIAAPNTNTDRTLTLPDATGTVVLADAAQTLTNKSIAASQLTGALPAISGASLTDLPAPTSAQVGTATGGLAYGDVGSYGLFQWISAGQRAPGTTVAASSLYPANAFSYNVAGYASVYGQPSGTWRLMGSTGYYSGSIALTREDMHTSVFMRVS